MKWSETKEWIGNEIGDEGAKTISESLTINTLLTQLNLKGDEKDKKWKIKIMKKMILKKWRRENGPKRNDKWIDNRIGDEGAKSFSEFLKINTSLTTLDLGSEEKKWNEKEQMKWNEKINK